MAETILMSFATNAALPAAGASVATSAAVNATWAGQLLSALPTTGSLVSNVAGMGSLLTSVQSGRQQAAVYKMQGQQAQMAAQQEELRGREQADKIRQALQRTLASQNATFAARGISPNSGTPRVIANESRSEASRDIELARFGAGQSAFKHSSEAGQYVVSSRSARLSGFGSALNNIYKPYESRKSLIVPT